MTSTTVSCAARRAPTDPAAASSASDPSSGRPGLRHAWNGVLWSGLDAAGADAAIAGQIAHYRTAGLPFEWKLYGHDGPADLADRLLAAGFTAEDPETLMAAEAAALPQDVPLPKGSSSTRSPTRPGCARSSRSTNAPSAPTAPTSAVSSSTGSPPTRTRSPPSSPSRPHEPVSAARLELCPGTDFAGLWGGGTVEAWRGRGLYRALVAHRVRIAAARGHRYVQVDAADTSRPILRRLGFLTLSTTTPYTYGT